MKVETNVREMIVSAHCDMVRSEVDNFCKKHKVKKRERMVMAILLESKGCDTLKQAHKISKRIRKVYNK